MHESVLVSILLSVCVVTRVSDGVCACGCVCMCVYVCACVYVCVGFVIYLSMLRENRNASTNDK